MLWRAIVVQHLTRFASTVVGIVVYAEICCAICSIITHRQVTLCDQLVMLQIAFCYAYKYTYIHKDKWSCSINHYEGLCDTFVSLIFIQTECIIFVPLCKYYKSCYIYHLKLRLHLTYRNSDPTEHLRIKHCRKFLAPVILQHVQSIGRIL